jgi:predicted transcriptional regulator
MEVHFSPDVETKLKRVAAANGTDAEQLVKRSVDRMLADQARFIEGVHRGIAHADSGELIDHEEVRKRINEEKRHVIGIATSL